VRAAQLERAHRLGDGDVAVLVVMVAAPSTTPTRTSPEEVVISASPATCSTEMSPWPPRISSDPVSPRWTSP